MVGPYEVPRRIVGRIVSSLFPQTDYVTSRAEALLQVVVDLALNLGKESIS